MTDATSAIERSAGEAREPVSRRRRSLSCALSTVVLIDMTVFVSILLALHVVRPHYDPMQRHLSEYAVGASRPWMVAAFLLSGLALVLLAIGLWRMIEPSLARSAACVLIAAAGALNWSMALCTTDLSVPLAGHALVRTTSGRWHDGMAAVHALVWLVAPLLLTRSLKTDVRWRDFVRVSLVTGLIQTGLILALLRLQVTLPGFGQRLWIASLAIWCAVHAIGLRRVACREGRPLTDTLGTASS